MPIRDTLKANLNGPYAKLNNREITAKEFGQ